VIGAAIRPVRLAATALVAAALATPPPLTNEDIVRLVANGTAESVVLREIAARRPDFDLDPGVVVELEHVGVSKAIIEAMRKRQIDVGGRPVPAPGPPPGAAPAPVEAVEQGTVVVTFAPPAKGEDPPELFAIASVPKNAPRPDDGESGLVSDLALVIACTSATHVPDHWDTRTPIEGAPRHELLLFHPGSHHRDRHGFDLLVLDRFVPDPIRLAAGRHNLLVALAGKHGSGAWRLLASDSETVEVAPGGTVRLRLDARSALLGSRMTGFRAEQVFKLEPEPAPPADAAPAAPEPAPSPAPPPPARGNGPRS
jgi:hypothetical protein